jgi:adenylate cyclase
VPSEVVEELTNSDAPPSLIGRKREVTVLFADLRGFTAFSEKRDPANVVALLNRFFDAMAAPLIACGGTIDKYIGDAVLAHFGGVRVDALAAEHAVRAALGMRASLVTLNRQLAEDGVPAFRFGVAINTGSCIVGNVGCSARMDYTVIGDAVNVAARVEGLTKGKDNCILITGATRALVSSRFVLERWPPTTVRGRQEEIDVYEVMAAQPDT